MITKECYYQSFNLPKSASWRDVVRATRKRLHPMFHRDRDLREKRHGLYRDMLHEHGKYEKFEIARF